MSLNVITVEKSEFQTTNLLNALVRAKSVANKLKTSIAVFINGKLHCTVQKNGKLIPN